MEPSLSVSYTHLDVYKRQVLDRWISGVQSQALQETGLEPGSPALTQAVDQKIVAVTSAVSELVHGFEFAKLLSLYYHAYVEGEEEKKQQVARWFRGEYATKREAKEELGCLLYTSSKSTQPS